jgi:AcrR family transcriptional regulator
VPRANERPTPYTQADRSSATKRALVDAAYSILLREGHTSATLVHVAKEAGVTRGAIQHHFPGRHDIWLETLAETQSRISSLLRFDDTSSRPITARALLAVERYWNACAGDDYLVALEIRMMARVDHIFGEQVRAHFAEVRRTRDIEWVRLFSDSKLSKAQLTEIRFLMTDILRGLAARRASDGAGSVQKTHVNLVKRLLAKAIAEDV